MPLPATTSLTRVYIPVRLSKLRRWFDKCLLLFLDRIPLPPERQQQLLSTPSVRPVFLPLFPRLSPIPRVTNFRPSGVTESLRMNSSSGGADILFLFCCGA